MLKNEYQSGIFLFVTLNLLLFTLNFVDIQNVWLNFEWEGQYLRQFVHSGTYLLILSILISIALVLFYFRGKINFYKQNKLLKFLSYLWLAQNSILIISVAIRNLWYIKYFALAYKRIGVFIFLILTLYGLYTVFKKVRHKKSTFYLLKKNSFAILLILICSSVVNWDSTIAKYNFKHSNESFLHLNFLTKLSNKTLPELDKTIEELNRIEIIQKEKFPFKRSYMKPDKYQIIIENRKKDFRAEWEEKSFLSWNYPEYKAYQKLFFKESGIINEK